MGIPAAGKLNFLELEQPKIFTYTSSEYHVGINMFQSCFHYLKNRSEPE